MKIILFLIFVCTINGNAQEMEAKAAIKPEVKDTAVVQKKKSEPSEPADISQKRAVLPTPQDDSKTEEVLSNLVKESGWFPNIQISVNKGMVTIKGSTKNAEQLRWLAETADRIPSVIAVINQATVDRPEVSDFTPALNEMRSLIESFKKALPLLGAALILLLIFIFINRKVDHGVYNLWARKISNPFLLSTVTRLTMIPIWIICFYLVLQVAGLSSFATTIIGGTGALGIIIGFAFKDIAENYLSGLLLSMRSPFTKGDTIIVDKYQGSVQSLSMRGTTIIDDNGNMILIPNRIVLQSVIQNSSRTPKSRITFSINISLNDSVKGAQAVILKALQNIPLVLQDPKPIVVADSTTKNSVLINVMFWYERKNRGALIKSDALAGVIAALKENGFNLVAEIHIVTQLEQSKAFTLAEGNLDVSSQEAHNLQGHEKDAMKVSEDVPPLDEKADTELFRK